MAIAGRDAHIAQRDTLRLQRDFGPCAETRTLVGKVELEPGGGAVELYADRPVEGRRAHPWRDRVQIEAAGLQGDAASAAFERAAARQLGV
ncbi:MAG TPA: hypothetical protein VG865_05245, partial [Casimicrobiaceae bacterium]|nr:hypothetical protein [Casimicrobiaceae bacterium]